MHSALVLSPVLVFIPLFAFIGPVLLRLMKSCHVSEITQEWFETFDVASYRPMRGLLAAEDFQFLSRQPGFDPSLFRKLKQERLRIFRQYLNRLIVDFNRLHTLARVLIAQNSEDRSDLFGTLITLRFRFWLAIMRVETSYLVCRLGMRTVVVGDVIQRLEEMRSYMASLPQPATLPA